MFINDGFRMVYEKSEMNIDRDENYNLSELFRKIHWNDEKKNYDSDIRSSFETKTCLKYDLFEYKYNIQVVKSSF